ncbi:MAG: GatB/YqeY domain-containing protein [Chloroflexota bacterium]
MNLKEQMTEDLKNAMKAGDAFRKDTLRMMLAEIKQGEIKQFELDKSRILTEEQIVAILSKESVKRRDSVDEMRKAKRDDLADNEQAELELIQGYLPEQMSREAIEGEVRKAIAESGATSPKDMGNVMKVLMPRVKGRADGKLVNEVVKSLLV